MWSPSARRLEYAIVDVFVSDGHAGTTGNPLAVVLDGDRVGVKGLSADERQALARWFGLSETAFPVRPTVAGADYRLLIHTPAAEIPFAGHPSVGSAWLLAALGRLAASSPRPTDVHQECGAGVVALELRADGSVELSGAQPEVGPALDAAPLLGALGLTPSDQGEQAARRASTGLPVRIVAVRPGAVARAQPDLARLRALSENLAVVEVRQGDSSRDLVVHARVFAADLGVPEDPATGSAALALGAYLFAEGLAAGDGETRYVVHQGAELGRPSVLRGRVDAAGGVAVRCFVAGGVRVVAHGTLDTDAVTGAVRDTD